MKIEYYSAFAEFYHRQAQMVNMDCADMGPYQNGGTFSGPQYWVMNSNADNTCMLTYDETIYSLWRQADYKACVLGTTLGESTYIQ